MGDISASSSFGTYDTFWQNLAASEVAAANEPNIRLFLIEYIHSTTPQPVFVNGTWSQTIPSTASRFSAETYLFALNLQRTRGIPIGLVEASLGGTHIREWVPQPTLLSIPNLQAYPAVLAAQLFNGMVAPLAHASFAGALWYQGEADSADSLDVPLYQALLQGLITSWRALLDNPTLPFIVVQLPNIGAPATVAVETGNTAGYQAPEVREAQQLAVAAVGHAGFTVNIDIGDPNNLHAPNKWDVGARLALKAESLVYGMSVASDGPVYRNAVVQGNSIIVSFNNADAGLVVGEKVHVDPVRVVQGGTVTGFAIADSSFNWVPATATIAGSTVVVSAPGVTAPVAVRYGWAASPTCNLYNADALLPVAPFRTDSQAIP